MHARIQLCLQTLITAMSLGPPLDVCVGLAMLDACDAGHETSEDNVHVYREEASSSGQRVLRTVGQPTGMPAS